MERVDVGYCNYNFQDQKFKSSYKGKKKKNKHQKPDAYILSELN